MAGGLLAWELIPLTRVRPVGDPANSHLVGRVIVARKPQFAVVIARNPERVAAGRRCRDIPAHTRAVVISPIGWRFKARQRVSEIRRRTHRNVRDGGAADPYPYLTGDRAGDRKGQSVGDRSAWVLHRDRSAARCSDVGRGDRRGELGRANEGGGAIRSIPAHHRTTHEIASVHRERKGRSARRSAARRSGGQRWRRWATADLDDACDRRYSASVEDEEQVGSGRRNSASGRSHNVEASRGLRKAQRADVLAHVESMGHRGESQHRDL